MMAISIARASKSAMVRASESAALRKLPERSATSAYRRCLSSIDTGDHASLGGNCAIEERTVSRIGENRAGDVDSVLHHLCHAPHAVLTLIRRAARLLAISPRSQRQKAR